jgi:hypothetical protein
MTDSLVDTSTAAAAATRVALLDPVGGYAFVAAVGAVLLLLLLLGPARDRVSPWCCRPCCVRRD